MKMSGKLNKRKEWLIDVLMFIVLAAAIALLAIII